MRITPMYILALIILLIPAAFLTGCIDERELVSLREENKILKDVNQRLTLENENLKQDIQKLKKKEVDLETSISELRKIVKELKERISHLERDKGELQALLKNSQAINEVLREKIAEYGAEVEVIEGVEGLKGEYFNLPPFSKNKPPEILPESSSPYKIFTRVDKTINFIGHPGGPNLSKYRFGVRWTGFIYIPVTGDYRFDISTDDNGIRLWIGNKLMYDQWRHEKKHYSIFTFLEGKRWYPIKIETFYHERWRGRRFVLILKWWLPGEEKATVIPSSNFKTGPIIIEKSR